MFKQVITTWIALYHGAVLKIVMLGFPPPSSAPKSVSLKYIPRVCEIYWTAVNVCSESSSHVLKKENYQPLLSTLTAAGKHGKLCLGVSTAREHQGSIFWRIICFAYCK